MSKWGNAEVVAVLSRSLADARAPFERLTNVLFLIAAVSLIASALAAFWLARNITRPLQDLTQAVDQMRAGTYDVALNVQRPDELGVLAEGLQLMQTAVQSRDQSIRRLAYEDSLTGLMNRTAFGAALGRRARRQARGAPIAVAVINLDRFRRINEHLGYSVGDAVLTKMAARLAAVPSVNPPWRASPRINSRRSRHCRTQAACRPGAPRWSWRSPTRYSSKRSPSTSPRPWDWRLRRPASTSADELMRCADLALEHARREKRALAVYEEALKPAARDQLSLLGELRHAVEHDELRLFFQPKIEFKTGRVTGAEVLLRWQHPTRGLLNPVGFHPVRGTDRLHPPPDALDAGPRHRAGGAVARGGQGLGLGREHQRRRHRRRAPRFARRRAC